MPVSFSCMCGPLPAPASSAPSKSSRRSRTISAPRSRPKNLHLILDNIGLPARTYNLAFTDGSTIGVNDGIIQIELADGHEPTAAIIKQAARGIGDAPFPTCSSISSRPISSRKF